MTLSRLALWRNCFDQCFKGFCKIYIVINTVDKVLKKPITEISEEEYDSMFAQVSICTETTPAPAV